METLQTPEQEAPRKEKKVKTWGRANPKGKRSADERLRETVHESRDQESREADAVHEMDDAPWVNPASLPYIKPRPGFRQRWVRMSMRGRDDYTNSARRLREGWQPRLASSIKGMHVPVMKGGRFDGCICVEGMVLCEMPEARAKMRDEFFKKKRQRQSASINEELQRISEHGSRAFGRIEKVETTKRVRPAAVAENE